MDCDSLAEVAAELALGVLTGRERAGAIVHLDKCGTCRERVRDLALTEEEVLGLLPGREPPPGFETRMIGGLDFTARRPWHSPGPPRWMLTAVAAAVITVVAGLGGWGLRGAAPVSPPAARTAQPALRTSVLTTASRHTIGKVYLYTGRPGWLYMTVDAGAVDGVVVCQLQSRDGRTITIGSFRLNAGHGHWASPEPLQPGTITGARLATIGGKTLAAASFSPLK